MKYQHENSSADGIVLAHALTGELVQGYAGQPTGGNIQRAGLLSTAPYVSDEERRTESGRCQEEGCKGYATKKTGRKYCVGHGIHHGLIEHVPRGSKSNGNDVDSDPELRPDTDSDDDGGTA